jgi:hypothetical protein
LVPDSGFHSLSKIFCQDMRYILVCKESDSCTMRYYVINLYMQPESP